MSLKIVFDCERMKYPHTGLYHYCFQLGMALKQEIKKTENELFFYVRDSEIKVFGDDAVCIPQHSLHKFLLPNLSRFDIWHTTYQGSQYFPFSRNIKKVLTVHDLNFLYDPNKDHAKRKRELNKLQKKVDSADAIIAISNFVLNDLRMHLNIKNKHACVIYNGCNFHQNDSMAVPINPPQTPFLYTIGTITEKKNFHVLPALLKHFDGNLIISGIVDNNDYKEKIISVAKQHHVEDRVVFTGPVPENDKQWYMQHCEAFVFPSLAEGFGLPVVEAMHLGKPVILSDKTSLPEIGGEDAFYFNNFEPEHMQKVLDDCLSHQDKIELSEKMKRQAAQFNWQHAAEEHVCLYKSL